MALQIIEDIAGIAITEEAFALLDSLGKARDLGQLTLANIWFPPGASGAILQPVCLTDHWINQAGRWGIADWEGIDPSAWEQIGRRSALDLYLQSKGLASGVLVSKSHVDANTPLFVEFHCFAQPGQNLRDYLIMEFGQNFRLHVHSDGTADLEDLRPGSHGQIIASGFPLTANKSDLSGKFVQIFILPWRRGRILFWTNQGGDFEAYVGARRDGSDALKSKRTSGQHYYYVTTEAAQIKMTPNPAARAVCTVNTYVTDGSTGSAQSPILKLPRTGGVIDPPLVENLFFEAQDRTTATITLTYYDDTGSIIAGPSSNTPAVAVQYTLSITSPDTTHTASIFGADIRWERGTGARQYQTNVIGSPNVARYTMSRERGQKQFIFELDNPHEKWTSLKDLYNRKMTAVYVPDAVDSEFVTVFSGVTDAPEFLDGVASRLSVPCSGLRKYLRSSLMSDTKSYDGYTHCACVLDILHDAGYDPPFVVVEEDGVTLETAPPGEDPYWRPAAGISRDEFIQHLCDTFSGYTFDDIGGVFYYVSREYWTASALAGTNTIPVVYMQTPMDPATMRPIAEAQGPNATTMVALTNSIRSNPEEPRANDIWVLGRDPNTGEIIAAHYEDSDSINNRLAYNYVGERRLFIYASSSITTTYMAYQACGMLANSLPVPLRPVAFSLPDFQVDQLPIEGPLYLEGFGLSLITAFAAELSNDRWRQTEYTCEVL